MNAQLESILTAAHASQASDIHLASGESVYFRVAGALSVAESFEQPLSAQWVTETVASLLTEAQQQQLADRGSVDGAFSWGEHRFRFNAFRRNENECLALRRLANDVPELKTLGIHESLYDVCNLTDGLILVAGPTGSGKSTTIASLIDRINATRQSHIITIEDPVEFVHPSKRSLVNQRQVGLDVSTFHQALLDAMRQDPDVILVGELRDLDTIRTAITAAETGHLVFATVHAGDTKTAVERLVSAYSAEEQNLAQRLVATVLRTVIVQHLLAATQRPDTSPEAIEATSGRSRVVASERVHVTSGIANLIASGNLSQLASIVQTSGDEGMWTLDESLARLLRRGLISEQTARSLARQPELLGNLARVRKQP